MALNDLTDQNIQDTYQRVVQTDGTNLADGTGSLLPISFDGNNVIISGSLTANEYIVSSSVTNIVIATKSGSTAFGDSTDDIHKFTGTLSISGSGAGHITASGNISASGNVYAPRYYVDNKIAIAKINDDFSAVNIIAFGFENNTAIQIGKNANPITLIGEVTASGNISASGYITSEYIQMSGLESGHQKLVVAPVSQEITECILLGGDVRIDQKQAQTAVGITPSPGTNTGDLSVLGMVSCSRIDIGDLHFHDLDKQAFTYQLNSGAPGNFVFAGTHASYGSNTFSFITNPFGSRVDFDQLGGITSSGTISASGNIIGQGLSIGDSGAGINGNVRVGSHDGEKKLVIERFNGSFPYAHIFASNTDNDVKVGFKIVTKNDSGTSQDALVIEGDTRDVTFANVVNATAINTGQGDNELHAMNQDVETSDNVTFNHITASGDISSSGLIRAKDGFYVGLRGNVDDPDDGARFIQTDEGAAAIQKADGNALNSLQIKANTISGQIGFIITANNLLINNVTASGDISASGKVYASRHYVDNHIALDSTGTTGILYADSGLTDIHIGKNDGVIKNIKASGHITASGNISSSGTGSFLHLIVDPPGHGGGVEISDGAIQVKEKDSNLNAVSLYSNNTAGILDLNYEGGNTNGIKLISVGDNFINPIGGGLMVGANGFASSPPMPDNTMLFIHGNISSSGDLTANNVTASGHISASEGITAKQFLVEGKTAIDYVTANNIIAYGQTMLQLD